MHLGTSYAITQISILFSSLKNYFHDYDILVLFDSRIIRTVICESMLSTTAEITPALLPW